MKKIFFLFVMAALISSTVRAQVPQTISYQGFYTDASGNPVTGGSHKIAFKFLDATSNVENTALAREIENVTINKGIISVVIGGGDPSNTTAPDNAPLPFNVWTQAFKIQVFVDGTSIGAAVPLTTVPYAFVAGSVDGSNITGTVAATKISGSVSVANGGTGSTTAGDARTALGLAIGTNVQSYDSDLDDLADGELTGTKVGSGISTANLSGTVAVANGGTGSATAGDARTALGLTIGTNVQAYDSDLDDLADGSLTGSKIGSGISAGNLSGSVAVANGGTGSTTAANARTALGIAIGTNVQAYDADLDDLADGSLTGSKVGTGINAANLTGSVAVANGGTGSTTAANARTALGLVIGTDVQAFDADLDDLADGSLTGSKVGSGISAGNLTGSVAIANGGTGSTTAANARTALGLAIGTDVQAFDADIADLADGILNTTGNITTAGGLHVGGSSAPVTDNLEVDGYTKLGGSGVSITASAPVGAVLTYPAIRILKITGTCAAADGTAQVTLSGLAEAKILSIDVMVEFTAGDYVHAGYTSTANLQFNYFYQGNILNIKNITGNSSGLAARPFKAIITYEE